MDPEIKAKWITALRSGQYQQVTSYLRTTQGFCCLGVLCDILEPQLWRKPILYDNVNYTHRNGAGGLPDGETLTIANISLQDSEELSYRNDHGHSFQEIAPYIEKHL
jgi:hypothetical protein